MKYTPSCSDAIGRIEKKPLEVTNMMKLMVRISIVALVFAGAAASAFTPKTQNGLFASHNSLVISSNLPIPSCAPGDGCTP